MVPLCQSVVVSFLPLLVGAPWWLEFGGYILFQIVGSSPEVTNWLGFSQPSPPVSICVTLGVQWSPELPIPSICGQYFVTVPPPSLCSFPCFSPCFFFFLFSLFFHVFLYLLFCFVFTLLSIVQ